MISQKRKLMFLKRESSLNEDLARKVEVEAHPCAPRNHKKGPTSIWSSYIDTEMSFLKSKKAKIRNSFFEVDMVCPNSFWNFSYDFGRKTRPKFFKK